jgi:hypothetical protein
MGEIDWFHFAEFSIIIPAEFKGSRPATAGFLLLAAGFWQYDFDQQPETRSQELF